MKNILPFFVALLVTTTYARAESANEPEIQLSLGQGFGISKKAEGETLTQLQIARMHSVFESIGRFQLGYGVRYSTFGADVLNSKKFSAGALNLGIHAAYQGLGIIDVGMNLDVAGLAIGPDVNHRTNLLRGGSNDLGFLNSEFYVMSRFMDLAFIRLSWMHVATGAQPQTFVDLLGLSAGVVF